MWQRNFIRRWIHVLKKKRAAASPFSSDGKANGVPNWMKEMKVWYFFS